ncbi:MAG: hypothetical protein AAF763_10295 [Pseudomonadota bacterium]
MQRIEAQGWERGGLGWATAFLELLEPDSGMRAQERSTPVFSMEAGVWRVVQVRNSNPKPNIEAHG